MIDFRYHVVSLIAVFIALAVGIVLGAGPLRGQLSDTLEGQVEELGAERNDLRGQVELNDRRAQAKDEIIDALSPAGIANVLEGSDVAVVRLPGSDADVGDDISAAVLAGGAQSVTRVEVQQSWEQVDDDGDRAQAVAELAKDLDTEDEPAQVLAAVLTGSTTADAGSSSPPAAAAMQLEQAGLLSVQANGDEVDPALPGAPDLRSHEVVLLLGGGPAGRDPADPRGSSVLQDRLDLVRALAETSSTVCVCGAGTETWQDPVADAEDPLVAAVRADGELADEVSTVDNVESSAGRLAAVWALARLRHGEAGHYGLAADAEGPLPPPPTDPKQGEGSLDPEGSGPGVGDHGMRPGTS